ncbi:MAG: UDP-N-acetylmuramate dehydrogenase [Alphaproteobacteria bacterium]|nr:UDP-N-acetylmuramate dehydrogenase [Alphaproteobacteria bacterium]
MTTPFSDTLLHRLPDVRGKLIANAALKDQTWFRVGGPAEVLFKPEDVSDLAVFLNRCPDDIPVTVIGAASNLLIRDGGIEGVVVKLGPAFASISIEVDKVTAGAAALDINIARAARNADLSGLEFMCGIPGTLGGALRMNAGAHGGELKDVVTNIVAIDRHGNKHFVTPEEMQFAYRHSGAPSHWIFVQATLRCHHSDKTSIESKMKGIQDKRGESQPIREKTGGSTFANPEGHKAWELIDQAGCRGLRLGGAMISDHHCNFLINTGDATAADLENLGETVRARVLATSGIDLQWEIKRVGRPLHNIQKGNI